MKTKIKEVQFFEVPRLGMFKCWNGTCRKLGDRQALTINGVAFRINPLDWVKVKEQTPAKAA